jgi:D-amino-acid oxidase
VTGDDDYYGYDDDSTEPDRAEAELAVNTIAGLFHSRSGDAQSV